MYPLSLEKQYQKFFIGEFRRIAFPFTTAVVRKLKNEIKADSDNSIRADSVTQMLVFLSQLREEYGDKIDTSTLESKIKKNFALIDAWSRDKTGDAIAKMYSRLNTPQSSSITGRSISENRSGELWMQVINLRKSLNEGLIDDVVKQNVNLIDNAFKTYFAEIESIIKQGIQSGKGHNAIAELLMKQFGINENRAKFWARDQASKFFGDTTRLRQKEAGIKGYIWRCTGGRKTRDTHRALEGTYHDWNDAPLVGGRKLHPGQDYNCRCWAEPAIGPEAAEKEYKGPADDLYYNFIRPGLGKPALHGSSTDSGLLSRIILDIDDPALKKDVEDTLTSIDKLLDIDTGSARALNIVEMEPSNTLYNSTTGYHFKSGNIAIKPGSTYQKSTVVHEFFHWIDLKVLPESVKNQYNSIISGIKKTDLYAEIKIIKRNTKDSDIREYCDYLLTPTELFARAMEQYVASSGIDKGVTSMFSDKKADYAAHYWVDSDFKNIYSLIDDMFEALGWKK